MAIVTDAIVLHAFDYLESSRILKLVTREAGVRSVLARGARSSRKRFGSALDLFAEGVAELHAKPGRDLDTLASFEVNRARPSLAMHLERFAGASAIAELTLRFARDAADPGLFAAVASAFDHIGNAAPERARETTLAGAWRILLELGVAPTIDNCAECHATVDVDAPAVFSHPVGGTLCERCARLARSGRLLPVAARNALRAWLAGDVAPSLDAQEGRAHQRLLREFLREHLADDRPMRAFEAWEREALTSAAGAAS
jgi:DNA repair protein RecO (recombination protein O)